MEEAEESRNGMMRTLKPSADSISSSPSSNFPSRLESTTGGRVFYRQFPPTLIPDVTKRPGIPPVHPLFTPTSLYPQISAPGGSAAPTSPANLNPLPSHCRSLSQPSFFSLDSLQQFTSSPFPDQAAPTDVNMENCSAVAPLTPQTPLLFARRDHAVTEGIPPLKAHRRSQSDIPFAFLQSSNPMSGLPPLPQHLPVTRESPPIGLVKRQTQFVKQEAECDREVDSDLKSEGDGGDDLINAYMNLDSLDTLNSSGTEDKRDDLDSKASGSKTNGAESSENEAESSMNEGVSRMVERKEGHKRSAVGDPAPINIAPRHCRSLSMDSFMGRLNFGEELPKPPPSPGDMPGQHSHSGSMDGISNTFSLEFGNGEFTGAEMKKIMANEKLAEIAMTDPKRAKRILANRQSAARSKERKMRYISELEHKVQTLQTEATTLSAQLTLLQRDSAGIASQNNHLKFRLQAMEQQAQLRDALNEALSAEVHRLKLSTGEPLSASLNHQIQLKPQMLQLQQQLQKHHLHASQMALHPLQSPEKQEQKLNADASDTEMKQ
ncbi:hypothetical protein M5K25_017364 [Dendrobium thyrsiflorum]|uniref:BZIP domain-containing protein n=1 Tax=Dendrobium thyrsiflorum TaxID=117978 RepID=A0ABD0UUB7_DENTH